MTPSCIVSEKKRSQRSIFSVFFFLTVTENSRSFSRGITHRANPCGSTRRIWRTHSDRCGVRGGRQPARRSRVRWYGCKEGLDTGAGFGKLVCTLAPTYPCTLQRPGREIWRETCRGSRDHATPQRMSSQIYTRYTAFGTCLCPAQIIKLFPNDEKTNQFYMSKKMQE